MFDTLRRRSFKPPRQREAIGAAVKEAYQRAGLAAYWHAGLAAY